MREREAHFNIGSKLQEREAHFNIGSKLQEREAHFNIGSKLQEREVCSGLIQMRTGRIAMGGSN